MIEDPGDFEEVSCPNCGGRQSSLDHEGRDPTIGPGVRFRIVRCDACGQHYTSPRPSLAVIGRYYPDDYACYRSDGAAAAGRAGSLKNLVLRDAYGAPSVQPRQMSRVVARLIESIRPPESFAFGVRYRGRGRLLDFGCGSGKFLHRMNALGWDVTGLDFSPTAVAAVRSSRLCAFEGTLPHRELRPRSFDVITMRHALEHVPDPRAILRSAWELLDASGMLVVQVPNYAGWEAGYFGDASLGVDLPRHLNHFTSQTLAAMFAKEGLGPVTVHLTTHPNWFRKASKRGGNGRKMAFAFGLSPVCRVAAMACQLTGRGNEIVATAIKPAGT